MVAGVGETVGFSNLWLLSSSARFRLRALLLREKQLLEPAQKGKSAGGVLPEISWSSGQLASVLALPCHQEFAADGCDGHHSSGRPPLQHFWDRSWLGSSVMP